MQEQQNPFKTTWPTWATVARFVSFTESFVSDNQWNSAREDQQPDRPNTLHSQPNHSLHGSFMLKGGWARSIVQMTLLYRNKVQIGSQRKPLLENLLAKGTSQLPLIIFFFFHRTPALKRMLQSFLMSSVWCFQTIRRNCRKIHVDIPTRTKRNWNLSIHSNSHHGGWGGRTKERTNWRM